jgi:hypothetical protein
VNPLTRGEGNSDVAVACTAIQALGQLGDRKQSSPWRCALSEDRDARVAQRAGAACSVQRRTPSRPSETTRRTRPFARSTKAGGSIAGSASPTFSSSTLSVCAGHEPRPGTAPITAFRTVRRSRRPRWIYARSADIASTARSWQGRLVSSLPGACAASLPLACRAPTLPRRGRTADLKLVSVPGECRFIRGEPRRPRRQATAIRGRSRRPGRYRAAGQAAAEVFCHGGSTR